MKTRLAAMLLASLVVLVPSKSRADDLLEHVPDDAFMVMRFASVDKVMGNAKDFLKGVGPGAADGINKVEQGLEAMTNLLGKGLETVDRKEPFYLVAWPYFDERQPVAVFLKAADERAVRRAAAFVDEDDELTIEKRDDGFVEVKGDRTAYFTKRAGYIAFTRDETIVKHLSKQNPKMKSFAHVLGKEALKLVNAGDVSVAVNAAPVVKKHKDDIEFARKQVNQIIDDLPDEQLGTGSPEQTKKLYKSIVKFGFDAVYDVQWAVGRINAGAGGASAEALIGFKKGSPADKFLASNPPSAIENLKLLPAKAPMYFGFKMDKVDWAWDWVRMNYGDNPKHREAIDKAFKNMEAAKLQSSVSSFALPKNAKSGMSATTIEEVKNPAKYREGWISYIQAVGNVDTPLLSQKFDYKEAAEKHKDRPIDLFTMTIKPGGGEAADILAGLYKKLFGGEKYQSRLAVIDNLVVQSAGNDKTGIRNVLDSLQSGKGTVRGDKEFSNTRGQLAETANLFVIVDVPRLIVDAASMLRDVPPFDESFELIPFNFAIQPPISYSGISIGTEPQALRIKIHVPVRQPKGVLQIFGPSL